jgi:hypothetical protein
MNFCFVSDGGGVSNWAASNVIGVRPVFLIACKPILEGG